MIDRRIFATADQLAKALAVAVAANLHAALEASGRASLAVSGGSTPKMFFAELSRKELPWENVAITLVDERWVPETDARSNAALVKSALLRNRAAAARFIPLYTGHDTPEAGIATAELALRSMQFPIDAIVLGMGTDGHTASFFPGGDNLSAALAAEEDGLLISMRAPGAGEPRITLRRSVLLRSRALYMHIEGAEKAAVLDRAVKDGPVDELPVRAMLQQDQADLEIFYAP